MAQPDPNAVQPQGGSQVPVTPTAPAVAGQASTAPPLPTFNLLPANAPVDPRIGASVDPRTPSTPNDPTASPFSVWGQNAQVNSAADAAYRPIQNMGGVGDRMIDFFSRQDPSGPTMDQKSAAGAFYSQPNVKQQVLANNDLFQAVQRDPVGMHGVLEPMFAKMQGAAAAPSMVNGKTVQDPTGLSAKIAQTGASPEVQHPFHEPHQYSEEEFMNATRGISWNQLNHLMSMQHYQTPQQQAYGQLMDHYSTEINAAGQTYAAMVSQGKPAADQKAASDRFEQLKASKLDLMTRNAQPGATYPLPMMNQMQPQ